MQSVLLWLPSSTDKQKIRDSLLGKWQEIKSSRNWPRFSPWFSASWSTSVSDLVIRQREMRLLQATEHPPQPQTQQQAVMKDQSLSPTLVLGVFVGDWCGTACAPHRPGYCCLNHCPVHSSNHSAIHDPSTASTHGFSAAFGFWTFAHFCRKMKGKIQSGLHLT